MTYLATIRRLGVDIEIEFYEAGNDCDARDKALLIATANSGILIEVRKA
jgi:hypothetical protein